MDEERKLSIAPSDETVFGEALRQKQRLQAALTVRHWLESFPDTGHIQPSKISVGQIAKTVLEHLEEGRIFFVVKSAGEEEVPIRARRVRISLPPITYPLISKPHVIQAHLVALQVRSDVTAADLWSEQGLEQLRLLYTLLTVFCNFFRRKMLLNQSRRSYTRNNSLFVGYTTMTAILDPYLTIGWW